MPEQKPALVDCLRSTEHVAAEHDLLVGAFAHVNKVASQLPVLPQPVGDGSAAHAVVQQILLPPALDVRQETELHWLSAVQTPPGPSFWQVFEMQE